MAQQSPYHSGELAAQERAGEVAIARRNGVGITDSVMPGARPFLKQQLMVLLASRGAQGAMWASILFGHPGFLSADDGKRFAIDLKQARVEPSDPLWTNLRQDPRLGALVIELSTRRRIRINGPATLAPDDRLLIEVEEAYPACPKYINRRFLRLPESEDRDPVNSVLNGSNLSSGVLTTIQTADMIFVATRSGERGYDVSHRGGSPGFVKVVAPNVIRWPEFQGNSMFNTTGNLVHDSHAGVVIPDFNQHRIVQLTGTAVPLWDEADPLDESGGTRRFTEMTVDRWQESPMPTHLTAEFLDFSPFNPVTTQ
jgi:predicted pyridoxine 5'-phosphate oxidase superfamily flavin-nucleotide-binding protein